MRHLVRLRSKEILKCDDGDMSEGSRSPLRLFQLHYGIHKFQYGEKKSQSMSLGIYFKISIYTYIKRKESFSLPTNATNIVVKI